MDTRAKLTRALPHITDEHPQEAYDYLHPVTLSEPESGPSD
jgi:hypothetical protein